MRAAPGSTRSPDPVPDTFVAELTGLLGLGSWQHEIPGCGSSCATRRCTPATARGPPTGRNSSGADTSLSRPITAGRRPPASMPATAPTSTWTKTSSRPRTSAWTAGHPDSERSTWPGPRSWPGPRTCWPASATWPYPEGELRDAAPKLLRYRLFHLPARLTRGQRNAGCTRARTGPGPRARLTPGARSRPWPRRPDPHPTAPTIRGRTDRERGTRRPEATVGPRPAHDQKTMIKTTW